MNDKRKNDRKSKGKKCSVCGKDYKNVGIFGRLMVPNCDCQKVNSAMDRKMLVDLMTYARNGIICSRLCDMLLHGKNYLVDSLNSIDCEKNFDYIREVIEKQTGIGLTEYDEVPLGYVKMQNLINREMAPLEEDDAILDYIQIKKKKIYLPRWIKPRCRVSPNKVCKYCGFNYQERSILINGNSFVYSHKPRCLCGEKIKIRIHKGLIEYILGALALGKWTEGACASLIQGESSCYDCRSERYESLILEIMDDIKTETGIEVENKGFGECKEALAFIRNSIMTEIDKCDLKRGDPVQDNWEFLRRVRDDRLEQ